MDDLERQLQQALARQEAPPWFEEKVLRAVARQPERRSTSWFGSAYPIRWATAALATLLLSGGIAWQHERQERIAGEAAKAQLQLALRITSSQLHKIEKRIESIEQD